MTEVRDRIRFETQKLCETAESELQQAQMRYDQVKSELELVERRLNKAKTRMAAARAIEQAANTHVILEDLKEGRLEG